MSNMFFWIIVLSFLIPIAMRWYKKSIRGRNQNRALPGGPDQFGQFPGGGSRAPIPGPRTISRVTARPNRTTSGRLRRARRASSRRPYQNPEPAVPRPGTAGRQVTPAIPSPMRTAPSTPATSPPAAAAQQPRRRPPTPLRAPSRRRRRPLRVSGRATRGTGSAVQRRRYRHGGLHGPARGDHEGLTAPHATRARFAQGGAACVGPLVWRGQALSRPGGSRGRLGRTGRASAWSRPCCACRRCTRGRRCASRRRASPSSRRTSRRRWARGSAR